MWRELDFCLDSKPLLGISPFLCSDKDCNFKRLKLLHLLCAHNRSMQVLSNNLSTRIIYSILRCEHCVVNILINSYVDKKALSQISSFFFSFYNTNSGTLPPHLCSLFLSHSHSYTLYLYLYSTCASLLLTFQLLFNIIRWNCPMRKRLYFVHYKFSTCILLHLCHHLCHHLFNISSIHPHSYLLSYVYWAERFVPLFQL